MPKALEEQLKRNVNQKHPEWSKERKDAYVYSTLRRVERKHQLKVTTKKRKKNPLQKRHG